MPSVSNRCQKHQQGHVVRKEMQKMDKFPMVGQRKHHSRVEYLAYCNQFLTLCHFVDGHSCCADADEKEIAIQDRAEIAFEFRLSHH